MTANDIPVLYEQHLNAGLVRLVKRVGLTATEARAEGCIIVDEDGNEWLDCIPGFGALNFGHCQPKIVEAVRKQLEAMPPSSRMLFSRPLPTKFGKSAGHGSPVLQKSAGHGSPALHKSLKKFVVKSEFAFLIGINSVLTMMDLEKRQQKPQGMPKGQ